MSCSLCYSHPLSLRTDQRSVRHGVRVTLPHGYHAWCTVAKRRAEMQLYPILARGERRSTGFDQIWSGYGL
jgi:hypothetical protein